MDNGGCQHDCLNTLGGFKCVCRQGYEPLENGSCVGECSVKFDRLESLLIPQILTSVRWTMVDVHTTVSTPLVALSVCAARATGS